MSKKRARFRFVWLAIIVAIGLFFAFVPFDIPWNFDTFNGFAGAIPLAFDLRGGQSVVFDCETTDPDSNLDSEIQKSLEKINNLVKRNDYIDYSEAIVSKQGQQIRVDVYEANRDFFKWLANQQKINITLTEYSEDAVPTIYLSTEEGDLDDAFFARRVNSDNTAYEFGVGLKFTNTGAQKLYEASKRASQQDSKTLQVYLGDLKDNNLLGTIDCTKSITDASNVFVESDEMLSDYNVAFENAYNIASGTLNISLKYDNVYNFSAVLGNNTSLIIAIAGAVALLLIMILMWVRYGDFGLLADFALLVFAILEMFFLQAIPLISLSLPTVIAILFSVALFVDGNVIIFERIKQEYASGKKIPMAVKSGFKRALWPILDTHVVILVLSLIIYFIGGAPIKAFAFPMLVGTVISFFTSMVITRFFVKSYLPLNSTNIKKLRLHREKGVVEIKEEVEQKKTDTGVNILATPTPDDKTGGDK